MHRPCFSTGWGSPFRGRLKTSYRFAGVVRGPHSRLFCPASKVFGLAIFLNKNWRKYRRVCRGPWVGGLFCSQPELRAGAAVSLFPGRKTPGAERGDSRGKKGCTVSEIAMRYLFSEPVGKYWPYPPCRAPSLRPPGRPWPGRTHRPVPRSARPSA